MNTEQFVKLISQEASDKVLNGYIKEGYTILGLTAIDSGILVLLQKNAHYKNTRISNDVVDGTFEFDTIKWKY